MPPQPGSHTAHPAYLLLQPVIVLHDASHDDIRSLHVKRDLSGGFILERGPEGMNTQEEHPYSAPVPTSQDRWRTKRTQRTPVFSYLAKDKKPERGEGLTLGQRPQENRRKLKAFGNTLNDESKIKRI